MCKKFASAKSVRMCICCRVRFFQKELLRLQFIDRNLCIFRGSGRSFYICNKCLGSPKLLGSILRFNRGADKNILGTQLMEVLDLWKESNYQK